MNSRLAVRMLWPRPTWMNQSCVRLRLNQTESKKLGTGKSASRWRASAPNWRLAFLDRGRQVLERPDPGGVVGGQRCQRSEHRVVLVVRIFFDHGPGIEELAHLLCVQQQLSEAPARFLRSTERRNQALDHLELRRQPVPPDLPIEDCVDRLRRVAGHPCFDRFRAASAPKDSARATSARSRWGGFRSSGPKPWPRHHAR